MNNISYKELYKLFKDVTPLKFDCALVCGKLGGKTCCDSVPELAFGGGMMLFPGEEEYIDKSIALTKIPKEGSGMKFEPPNSDQPSSTLDLLPESLPKSREDNLAGNHLILASCGEGTGSCNRELRPLSCRVFPLFPTITAEGIIKPEYDMRGFGSCPLIRYRENFRLEREFVRRVRIAGRIIAKSKAGRRFLEAQTCEINEIEGFHGAARSPICRRKFKDRNFIK